ncbi:MAG: D-2-hydroxyacid dehydrogenase family protein [Bacteroidia bacterium]
MRITFTDDYQDVIQSLDCFRLLSGHDITILHKAISDEAELAVAMNNPEVLILNRERTPITENLLSLLPSLKIISQTGTNSGHIDIKACKAFGVTLLEGRGDPTAPAELTWLLIMSGLRQFPRAVEGMKDGKWQTNLGHVVKGKTIGIWSYGRIGKLVAGYAKAFGARVLIWGSEESQRRAATDGYEIAESKNSFFSTADVVSIHLRLNETTRGQITKSDLSVMKPTSLIVNTSRAELMEENVLLESLKSGRPGFAAIDVYESEPIYDKAYPLLNMPNVICSPHLGYVEKNSYELYFGMAIDNVLKYISTSSV